MIPAGYKPLKHADQKDFSHHHGSLMLIGSPGKENIAVVVDRNTKTYSFTTEEFKSRIYSANRWNPALLEGMLNYFAVNEEFLIDTESTLCKVKQLIKESKAQNKLELKERCKELLQKAYLLPTKKISDREQIEAQTQALAQAKVDKLTTSNSQLSNDYVGEATKANENLALTEAHERLNNNKGQIGIANKEEMRKLQDKFETEIKVPLEKTIEDLKTEIERLYTQLDKDADTVIYAQDAPMLAHHKFMSIPGAELHKFKDDMKQKAELECGLTEGSRLEYVMREPLAYFSKSALRDYMQYVMMGRLDYEEASAFHCAQLYAVFFIYKNNQFQDALLKEVKSKLELNEAIELLDEQKFPNKLKFNEDHPLVRMCLDKVAENLHLLESEQRKTLLNCAFSQYLLSLFDYNNLKIREKELETRYLCLPSLQHLGAKDKLRQELVGPFSYMAEFDTVPLNKQIRAMANRYTASLKSEISSKEVFCEIKEGFDLSKKHEITLALSPTDLFKRNSFTKNYSIILLEKEPSSHKMPSFTFTLGVDFEQHDKLNDQFKFRCHLAGHNYQSFHSSFKIIVPSQVIKGTESATHFYGCAATYAHEALANKCVSLLNNRYLDSNGEKSDYLPIKIEFQLDIKKK